MGSFDWTGHDYRGEESPTGWPAVNSHFGGIDLSGFEKDAMMYFKAWFVQKTPLVHIVPQDVSMLASTNDLNLFPCSSSPSRWKFGNSTTTGSLIQSATDSQNCIKGEAKFPASVYPCDPNDPSFLFYKDQYDQIWYKDKTGAKYCMDMFGGSGPQVGFFGCKNAPNTNQDWVYQPSGVIQSTSQATDCVGAGGHLLVYTNGDSVEFFVDGMSIGRQAVAPYDAGTFLLQGNPPKNITAVAKKLGATWATQTISNTGSQYSIAFDVERPQNNQPIFSDGQDVALLRASVLDNTGKIIRLTSDLITFTVVSGLGRIVGTGNGNPSDHTPDQGNQRAAWNGYARVIVGANMNAAAGTIVVQATLAGLKSTVIIYTVPPPPGLYL